jgi:Family of unknown function (DUF5313)
MTSTKPNLWQHIAYSYGRCLPSSMSSWVANDLAGKGAVRRHMTWWAIPPLFVLAPFWLLPASALVHAEMTSPLYAWALLISLALNKVWRRHRLAQHGLDPNLVDVTKREKQAKMHEDYVRRFGPRPESAAWQANSNPFN